MAFTPNDDFNIIQASDSATISAGAGDDTYILSAATIGAGQQVTISDTQGINTLQLVGGLTITSSQVANDAVQLTLNNGAVVTLLSASAFNFNVGGNALAGIAGTNKDYATFAQEDLGVTVPAEGEAPENGGESTIGEGPVDPEEPTDPTFTLTASADSVDEGSAATFALSGEANTTYSYNLSGVEAEDVAGGALTGTVTTDANGAATISVELVADRTTEGEQTLTVTIPNTSMSASTVVNDTSLDNVAPVAEDAAVATTEAGAAVEGQLVATDAEGDALTFALDAAVEGLTLNADGSYTFDPSANTAAQALTYTDQPLVIAAAYTVTDALGAVSESKTLSITVEPTPLTIELVADANFVEEGSEIAYTLVASEAIQGEDITGTIQILPGDGTSGQTDAADFGSGSFNPQTVTIAVGETVSTVATITPTNDAAAELPESYTASATVEGFEIADLAGEVRDPSSVGGLGQTFTLTTGIDTIPGLNGSAGTTGTDGDDTIVALVDSNTATNSTLNALDQINAGLGEDTLTLNHVGTGNTNDSLDAIPAGVTIQNVETINIRSSANVGDLTDSDVAGDDAAAVLNLSNIAGLNTVNVTLANEVNIQGAATTDMNVSGASGAIAVAGGQNVTVTDTTAGNNITIGTATVNNGTVTVTDNIAAATIAVDGGTDVSVTATGATGNVGNAITVGTGGAATDLPTGAVEVSNTAAAIVADTAATPVALGDIAVTGGTTVNVTQSANAANGVADNLGDVVTQGDVTVTAGNSTTSVTVVQDDQAAAVAAVAAVAGVNQTQTVTFSAMTAGQSVTVNGLTFTAAKALTAAEAAQAFANLTNGDLQDDGGPTANGVYTGANNTLAYTSGAANGAVVTYTAVAQAANTVALTVGSAGATAPVVAAGTTGVANIAAVDGVVGVASGAVSIQDNATASITDVVVDSYNAANIGTVTALNSLQNLTLKNSAATTATVATAATTLNLTLDDVDGAVNLDSGAATITNLTINTEGTASTGAITAAAATTVTINAEAALSGASTYTAATLIDVNGSAAVDLTGATTNAATLQTIDASGNTGGVTAVLGNTNAVAFTGGAGDDSLTLGAAAIAAGDNILLGAGNDTLVLAAGTTAATIAATVDGGEGTADVLSMGYADAVAVSGTNAFDAEVVSFERLTINNVVSDNDSVNETFTVNLGNLTYDYVTAQGTTTTNDVDTLALTNVAANSTLNVVGRGTGAAGADVYTVTLADATGAADVLNMVVTSANVAGLSAGLNAGTITATGVETYNVSSTTADADGSAGNTLAANEGTAGVLTTINVSGNTALTLTSNATAVTTVDASAATGALTYTANDGTTTVTGGAGADILTGAGNSDVLIGGAGNDQLTGANLTTLTGGAGNDTFFMNVATNVNSYSTITDLSSGDVVDLGATATTVFQAAAVTLASTAVFQDYANAAVNALGADADDAAWFQFGGNTYIVKSGADHSVATGTPDFQNGTDAIIEIVGLVDLSTASFNATQSTIEIA